MDKINNAANYVSESVKGTPPSTIPLCLLCPSSSYPSPSPPRPSSTNSVLPGAVNTGSKEANKEVAKDNNADVSTRLSAGKDALGDKVDEKKHNVSAETVSNIRCNTSC